MIDFFGNDPKKDYPILLFTTTYKGVSMDYMLKADDFEQWDGFNIHSLSKEQSEVVRPLRSDFNDFTRQKQKSMFPKDGSFYDLLVELQKAIKQKYPNAVVGKLLIDPDKYNTFPNRPIIIDDSETLELIRRGKMNPHFLTETG
ncbi:MAG: hypothetical protein LBK82_15670 [Planctomycetaceae bacterium]|jgi:hypothetical protein|nr:hypothetical protein [Planctomycetaceae bacterium]